MVASDYILILITWTHNLAAVTWIGGCIFYYLVLRPVFANTGDTQVDRNQIADQFRQVVKTTIWILIVTGIVLAVSEVAIQSVSLIYVMVLGIKVSLAVVMFILYVLNKGSNAMLLGLWGIKIFKTDLILFFGVLVIGISDVLSALSGL